MLILEICVRVFFGIVETRILKLCIHMDNELLYCGIENWTPCSYSSLYLSIFLSFKAKFVLQFSQELCKLESSNMVYMCRISYCFMGLRLRTMSCCIVGLRIRLIAHILHLIYPFFCLFRLNLCHKFLRYCTRKNLQTWYTYVIWVIVSWDRDSGTLLIFFYFLSSFLSFPILHVNIKNLCQSFLWNC